MSQSSNQPADKSTDMLAKEAIDHINNSPLSALNGFVPEDEDRVTVLRAWKEKQQEKEEQFLEFYIRLRKRIIQNVDKGRKRNTLDNQVIDGLLFLPDLFYLMVKLLFDREVAAENKGALLAGILYAMSPIDLLPDFMPVIGWVDDLVVVILALNKFLDTEDDTIRTKVDAYWLNDKDFFETFKHLLDVGDQAIGFLPKKFFSIIKNILIPRK